MPSFDVSPAAPHELLPACRFLFNAPNSEGVRERLLSAGAASGLFVARAGGRVCAAALAQALPGALGVTCPPRGDSPEAEDAATRAACGWLKGRGVKVCQAFAFEDEFGRMGALERAGFRYTTQLVFMRRVVRNDRGRAPWPPDEFPLTLRPYEPEVAQLFARTLVATHEASLDCPELNTPRTSADVLDGFSESAPPSAKWHRVLALDSADLQIETAAGVLLLGDGPGPLDRDICYIGVAPRARGRGYGDWLIRSAVAVAVEEGDDALTVSVDARNTPAVRLYAKHGFVEYERRGVWLATWPA